MAHLTLIRLALCAWSGVVFASESPPEVAPVHTWKDLIAQPALRLRDGTRCKLGRDAAIIPAGRGMLIYLLLESAGEHPYQHEGHPLGPLSLVCTDSSNAQAMQDEQSMLQDSSTITESLLYMTRIETATNYRETWEIRENAQVIATFQVQTTTEPWFGWSTLIDTAALLSDPIKEAITQGGELVGTGVEHNSTMQMPPCGPGLNQGLAVPDFESDWRYAVIPRTAFSAGEGLPLGQLHAALPEVEPAIPLAAAWRAGEDMHVALPYPVRVSGIRDIFLARWWCDGLPLVATTEAEYLETSDQAGLEAISSHLVFHLNNPPLSPTCRPGSEISVEFLICPDGWTPATTTQKRLTQELAIDDPRSRSPQRSNRVTWSMPE